MCIVIIVIVSFFIHRLLVVLIALLISKCGNNFHPFFVLAASHFQLLCLKRQEALQGYSWCQYLLDIDTRWQIPLPRLLATATRLHQTIDLHQHHHAPEKVSKP